MPIRFNGSAWGPRAICATLALSSTFGCSGARDTRDEQHVAATPFAQGYTAPPAPPLWPSFRAEEYRTFKGRPLTAGEIKSVRGTLGSVKPCQRTLLRFAFPQRGDGMSFVLFFYEEDKIWPHVLWTKNMYFKRDEGRTFPGSGGGWVAPGNGISYDVEHTPC